jgi:hypothetical protein
VIAVGRGAQFTRECLARFGPRINHAHQHTPRPRGGLGRVLLRVETTEVSGTNDRCPKRLHGLLCAQMTRKDLPVNLLLAREARILLWSLAAGAFAVPPLIWLTGRALLGPYANGGIFALWGDFAQQVVSGSLAAWIVLLGPFVLLSAARLAVSVGQRL